MDEESHDEVELEPVEQPGQKARVWPIVALIGGGCLLLVAVVFMLIASLLLPALERARVGDRTLNCKNNLRQLGLALVQYIDERGGHRYYPCPKGRPGVPDDYSGKEFLAMVWWTDLVSEPGIFICRSSTDDNNKGADLGVRDGQYLARDKGGIGQTSSSAPADVPKPRWTKHDPQNNHYISYASKGWKVSYMPGSDKPEALIEELPSDTVIASDDTVDPPNHRNGFCVLFADSHVEFLSDAKYIVTEEDGAVGREPPLDMICN